MTLGKVDSQLSLISFIGDHSVLLEGSTLKNNVSKILIATAASSAAPFAVSQANAQDLDVTPGAIDYRINLAFEGGALLFNNAEEDDKLGGIDKLGTNGSSSNAYGAISYSRMYDNGLDWRLSGAAHFASNFESDFTVNSGGNSLNFGAESDFNYQTVDFDLGKHVKNGQVDIRLFAGLRALHSRERIGTDFTLTPADPLMDKSGQIDKLGTSDFLGIGPRLGADIYYDMGQNWGLTGGASAAAMWGRRKDNLDFTALITDPTNVPPDTTFGISQSNSSSEVVTNFSLNGGVTWDFMPGKTITGGYRLDHWRNLRGFADDDGYTAHGPYLKINVKM
jgi:hypothetical protein